MLKKYFSIVIIPRRTSGVKKIRIPVLLLGFFGVVVVGLLSGLVYIAFDYISVRRQIAGMEELQRIKELQEKRIEEFEQQHRDLQLHFNHLTALNDKLKSMVITSIEADRKYKSRTQNEEELSKKLEIARKTSILDVIESDSSEIDSDLKYEQELRFANLIAFYKRQENPFSRIPEGLPVNGYLVDEFGLHTDLYTGQTKPQNGIGIASRLYLPVAATADGIVLELKQNEDAGNLLVVDHGNGFKTLFGHLGRYEVEVGDLVKKGSVIAQVGNTGRVSGPRLYYEVLFNEVPQNPLKYLEN